VTDADISPRRATPGDTEPCYELFIEVVVDLTRRQGVPWDPDVTDAYRGITFAPPFVL